MRSPSDRDWSGTCWLVGGLLLAALCFWNAFPHPGLSGTTSSDSTISRLSNGHTTIPIEHIRVGDRVVTELPKEAKDADRSRSLRDRQTVDPSTWRLVRLRAETAWGDGTIDDINVVTLLPPDWIAFHNAEVGTSVPIPLDLVEMGLPETLLAKVLAIERCPPIKDDPGQVVLTTINHLNNYVFDLTIEDKHGQTETIGVTGFHKFYSATQQGWISAEELSVGEELNGQDRMLRVVSLERRANIHRVFNFTVERDHVYRVSGLAALVHNADCREFAEALVNQHGGGMLAITPLPHRPGIDPPPFIDMPPGYPEGGAPFGYHVVHIRDGIITDEANPAGVVVEDWLEEYAVRTNLSVSEVLERNSILPAIEFNFEIR